MDSVFGFKFARCMYGRCPCCFSMKEPRNINVLNNVKDGSAEAKPGIGVNLAAKLQDMMMNMKANYIKDTGKVDYAKLKESRAFSQYCLFSTQLTFVDFKRDLLQEDDRKAFFINLYNCLTIHALVSLQRLPRSPADVQNMWSANAYNVGGLILSLDDIEHGILRGNRGHPIKRKPMFTPDDPRNALVVQLDPKIHFALNCGAKSCPPVKVYIARKLDAQLMLAAAAFNSSVTVDHLLRKVTLSKLFLWYREDFGSTDRQVLERLATYLNKDQQSVITYAINDNYGIRYSTYDWELNAE